MNLWHFLTRTRLEEKIEYARLNNGDLLLHAPDLSKDITKGQIKNYIYCLPSILSGMNFGDDASALCLLQIKLKESAKGYKFRGNPKTLNYNDLAEEFDFIDMIVDATDFSSIRFRQILLLNNSAIQNWHHSLQSNFKSDFDNEYAKLNASQFQTEDFFMIDFDQEEIKAAVNINGHLLGYHYNPPAVLVMNRNKIESGLSRLGAI